MALSLGTGEPIVSLRRPPQPRHEPLHRFQNHLYRFIARPRYQSTGGISRKQRGGFLRLQVQDAGVGAHGDAADAQPIEDLEAERARVREKAMSDGPRVPAGNRSLVDSEARAILRQKLLRDDPPTVESARA